MRFRENLLSMLEFENDSNNDEKTLLFLMPLIQMAWVCSAVSPREKHVIFLAAREDNIDEKHIFNDLIDHLLKIQPSKKFFEDCIDKINHLLASMTVIERNKIKSKILERCKKVAAAAGKKSLMDTNHHISDDERLFLLKLKEQLG